MISLAQVIQVRVLKQGAALGSFGGPVTAAVFGVIGGIIGGVY